MDELWARSRSGSHAGRGFHYQDAVATEFAVRAWRGEIALGRLIPEGHDDVSLELEAHALHLQVKSRRSHRGDFSEADLAGVWRHLADRLAADETAHVGIVLERPLAGVGAGLDRPLADASASLKKSIADAVGDLVAPEHFLSHGHVLVMPAAPARVVALLADRLGAPPASCLAHYEILRGHIAELADENGVRAAAQAAALTATDIARVIDDVSEAVEPSLLEEAVESGAVELVDFATVIDEPRFYDGVDVIPGHVAAGLPLERDDLVGDLEEGLATVGVALAVGPSGVGKSALIWLAAFASRNRVRWYRVRRLRGDDVAALVRLVKGLRPTGASLGFVVDDLGRDDREGYDALVSELRHYPEAVLLGACREEDLFVIRTAPGAVQVRPALDEPLAERIWQELRASGETTWLEWREPFEASEGLLLEYGHLLTAGARLGATITAQVERRVREQRALELELLGLVALADAYGAELELERLGTTLGASDASLKRALIRLVDEHLIREGDGVLGGLHELRSRHITRAIHEVPPPTITETVQRAIQLIDATALQRFLTRLLLDDVVADEIAINAVAARLEGDPDAVALAAALQALRLVGFRRLAAEWSEVFAEEGVAPTDVGVISLLALHGGDDQLFPEPIRRAVARIVAIEPGELRAPLLARVAAQIPSALAAAPDVATAATVLAALAEVGGEVAIEPSDLARLADGAQLEDLRLLLEAAHAASPELACAVADKLGGSAGLLARLEREQPWVRDARLGADDEGRPKVEAEYVYVAEAHQPTAHEAVVELVRYLAALAPAAEVAVCRAVDATGDTAGLGGVPLADKVIDRRDLPSRAEVAWNRARGRAAIAAVAAPTMTAYASAACEIVAQAAQLMRSIGDAWVRGQLPTKRLFNDAVALAEAADRIAPPPIAIEAAGPLEEGELPTSDPVTFIGRMIPNVLVPGLFQGTPVAPLIPQLIEQVDELADPERWRLLRKPPLNEVASLRKALLDLHAVVAEQAAGDHISVFALRNAGKKGLVAAARVARQRAGARMQQVADTLERALKEAGFSARVVRREGQLEPHRWPSDDFLVLVEVDSIYRWQREAGAMADICRPLLKDRVGFFIAPVRLGEIVGSFAVKVITDIFPDDTVRNWLDLPLPLLDERVTTVCGRGLSALAEISGIVASARASEVHDDEAAVIEAAAKRANETLCFFNELVEETDHPMLVEIGGGLLELARRVEDEGAALEAGTPVGRGVASSFMAGLKGDPDDVFATYIGLVTACVEYDIDPDGAWGRFQEALAASPG